jgi:hypothetical protein
VKEKRRERDPVWLTMLGVGLTLCAAAACIPGFFDGRKHEFTPGAPCGPGEEMGAGGVCYPSGDFGETVGAAELLDGGPVCHRQCRAILGPGGNQMEGGVYPYRCGPCLVFCPIFVNGNPVIVAIPQSDAGCSVYADGGT